MKSTILIFLFLLSMNLTGQTYSSIIKDKEITSFLEWITKRSEIHHKEAFFNYLITRWDSSAFYVPKDTNDFKTEDGTELTIGYYGNYLFRHSNYLDTIFINKDNSFLKLQFHAIKDSMWHGNFDNFKLLSKERPRKTMSYSLPLFSIDRKFVIIKVRYSCGSLCADGGIDLYKKVNKKAWKFVRRIQPWAS